jgi:WD40 repeat protein
MALSPNGEQFAVGYYDTTIGLWNVTSSVPFKPQTFTNNISRLAFSPDGDQVASTSEQDYAISIWDSYQGGQVLAPLRGHGNVVRYMAFLPTANNSVYGSGTPGKHILAQSRHFVVWTLSNTHPNILVPSTGWND